MVLAAWIARATAALADDRPASSAIKPDYKVAIWYDRGRPLDTFKYQVYDLRKGQYTQAVEDWLELMQTRYPGYEVRIRDVVLAREKGATESLRVGSVIHRELLAAAALEGVFLGEPLRLRPSRPMLPTTPRPLGRPVLPGTGGSIDLNPPRPSFPVPVPYPRPHP
jgi:hypothetical protein